jgi:hypothetical protein
MFASNCNLAGGPEKERTVIKQAREAFHDRNAATDDIHGYPFHSWTGLSRAEILF